MGIRQDIKEVTAEFSSILAGFKLALIVISYFGLGSIAKWVIGHWFPFTRWVWDILCDSFTIPHLPIVVKDSLTALVFFLPLGVAAIRHRNRDNNHTSLHRIAGGIFGVLFLFLILKDTFSSLAQEISDISPAYQDGFVARFAYQIDLVADWFAERTRTETMLAAASYLSITLIAGYLLHRRRRLGYSNKKIIRLLMGGYLSTSLAGALSVLIASASVVFTLVTTDGPSSQSIIVLSSFAIIMLIFSLMAAAVAFAPRKLLITTGAALAFVLAALIFELAIFVIRFIETAPVS